MMTTAIKGKHYSVAVTGLIRPVMAICVDETHPRYHRPQFKVLSEGLMYGVILKGDDIVHFTEVTK